MAIDRSTILRGPAVVQFDGASYFTKGDVQVDISVSTFDVATSAHGKVDQRVDDRVCRVRFTPAGEIENLGVTWPYGSMVLGTSIFTGTDKPLVVHTLAGRKLTFSAAAITRMPGLRLAATSTIHGEMEFTCLGANNEAWTEADNLVAIADTAYSDATFAPASIVTQPYTGVWGGSAPWSTIKTFDGWTVDFDLGLSPVTTDADGVVDMMFSDLTVRATCKPQGVTESELIAALKVQGSGATRGRSLQANSNDLVLTGTGLIVTLKSAQISAGSMAFSPTSPRMQDVTWIATRPFATGVAGALFTLATS